MIHTTERGAAAVGGLGLAFLACDVLRIPVLGTVPLPNVTAGEAFAFYTGNAARVLWSSVLLGVAMALGVGFFGALGSIVRRGSDPQVDGDTLGSVIYGAVLTVVAVDLVRIALLAVLGLRGGDLGPDLVLALHLVTTLLGGLIGFPIAAAMVALGLSARTGTLWPRWLAPASFALGGAWLASGLRITTTSSLAWGAGAVVFAASAVLVAGLSLSMVRGAVR